MDLWETLKSFWGAVLEVKTILTIILKCCLPFTVLIFALMIREAMVGKTSGALEKSRQRWQPVPVFTVSLQPCTGHGGEKDLVHLRMSLVA